MIRSFGMKDLLWPILLAAAAPAWAQEGPEQLDQIEPMAGEWQAEYLGSFGGDGSQSIEALVGVNDLVALGAEAEFTGPGGGLRFESTSLVALFHPWDPAKGKLGFAIKLQATIDREGHFAGAEARAIVESRTSKWWLQGDAILRHAREGGVQGNGLAYAASAQHAVGGAWLGIEASGQLARLSGNRALAPERRHYAGPSITVELPVGNGEVELNLAWLQRLRGDGQGSGPRMFAQFTF